MSKFDWDINFRAFCDLNSSIPYQSPIFGSFKQTTACKVPFSYAHMGYKSCLNNTEVNYYIRKTRDVFDYLKNNRQNILFSELRIKYLDIDFYDPYDLQEMIMHSYMFAIINIKIKPLASPIL